MVQDMKYAIKRDAGTLQCGGCGTVNNFLRTSTGELDVFKGPGSGAIFFALVLAPFTMGLSLIALFFSDSRVKCVSCLRFVKLRREGRATPYQPPKPYCRPQRRFYSQPTGRVMP